MSYFEDIHKAALSELPWDKLNGCNILVTGATGLIGSTLIEVLMSRPARNYKVYAAGRNQDRAMRLFSAFAGDSDFVFLQYDVMEPLHSDVCFHYIIHAASNASPNFFVSNPVEVMMANIIGTRNLLDYGKEHGLRRFLFVSSGEVYGEGDGRVFTEDFSGYVNPVSPRSAYPSSKRAAETLCVAYHSEYGMDTVIARPCHVYGPNFTESDNRVYAQFIRNVLRGEDIVLKSTGSQFRSWCYSVDCAAALLYILLKGETCNAYNIADENSNISIRELAEMIARIGDRQVVFDLPSDVERNGYNPVSKSVFSAERLKSLGWQPAGTMSDDLEVTINHRRE